MQAKTRLPALAVAVALGISCLLTGCGGSASGGGGSTGGGSGSSNSYFTYDSNSGTLTGKDGSKIEVSTPDEEDVNVETVLTRTYAEAEPSAENGNVVLTQECIKKDTSGYVQSVEQSYLVSESVAENTIELFVFNELAALAKLDEENEGETNSTAIIYKVIITYTYRENELTDVSICYYENRESGENDKPETAAVLNYKADSDGNLQPDESTNELLAKANPILKHLLGINNDLNTDADGNGENGNVSSTTSPVASGLQKKAQTAVEDAQTTLQQVSDTKNDAYDTNKEHFKKSESEDGNYISFLANDNSALMSKNVSTYDTGYARSLIQRMKGAITQNQVEYLYFNGKIFDVEKPNTLTYTTMTYPINDYTSGNRFTMYIQYPYNSSTGTVSYISSVSIDIGTVADIQDAYTKRNAIKTNNPYPEYPTRPNKSDYDSDEEYETAYQTYTEKLKEYNAVTGARDTAMNEVDCLLTYTFNYKGQVTKVVGTEKTKEAAKKALIEDYPGTKKLNDTMEIEEIIQAWVDYLKPIAPKVYNQVEALLN